MNVRNARLDVAVNLLWLAPGRVGGSEEYLVRQLVGLPTDVGIEPVLYVQRDFAGTHAELASRMRTEVIPFQRDWRGARLVAEHTWLAARTRTADVVHHGGGTMPVLGHRPALVTVHDLQYLRFPEYFSRARRAYLHAMMARSIKRAAVVATPSEFVRSTVIDAFGADSTNVVVVPHGIPNIDPPDPEFQATLLERYGLADRPYVVYPAITHPHKRHMVLVEMLRFVAPELMLVLLGGVGPAETALRTAIEGSGMTDRVVRPGRVPGADRDALIAGAQALVFPSEYEGFGAPLIEAMAAGTPVVCSDHVAVREVVGDAAIVVGGGAAEWAQAVNDAHLRRSELVAAGHRRRQAFTLQASGRALATAYRLAAS